MVVVGGGHAVEGDGEDLVCQMRGCVKFERKSKIFQIWMFNMSHDQYSHTRQQFRGMNDYCDTRGSIYPEIRIMALWRKINHSGHTPPRNHNLPHLCDFPDVVGCGGIL